MSFSGARTSVTPVQGEKKKQIQEAFVEFSNLILSLNTPWIIPDFYSWISWKFVFLLKPIFHFFDLRI